MPLFVIATPLGNLGDLAPRAREALSTADLALCEDTRVTRRLLASAGIGGRELWSCHAHNEEARVGAVLERLGRGEAVALVTDAGTPGVSDPGARIVRAVHAAGLPVVAVAGPSAVAAALSVSGLPAVPFHFLGFPPRKAGERDRWIAGASRYPGSLVLFESGQRVGELLAALCRLLPDRSCAICRELTKVHEEVRVLPLREAHLPETRGEFTLVVGPGAPVEEEAGAIEGEDLKAIAAALARRWGCARSDAYRRLVELEESVRPANRKRRPTT